MRAGCTFWRSLQSISEAGVGSAEEILAGARGRGFDRAGMHLMKKVKVNGPDADAVFLFLKQEAPCQIKWNFGAYFVVDGAGTVDRSPACTPATSQRGSTGLWPRRRLLTSSSVTPRSLLLCGAAADSARRRRAPPGPVVCKIT